MEERVEFVIHTDDQNVVPWTRVKLGLNARIILFRLIDLKIMVMQIPCHTPFQALIIGLPAIRLLLFQNEDFLGLFWKDGVVSRIALLYGSVQISDVLWGDAKHLEFPLALDVISLISLVSMVHASQIVLTF